jgi:alcohol dehydrogenase (cytochrome c)
MNARFLTLAAALCSFVGVQAQAQAYLDPKLIGAPPVDAWTTYHGDNSGQHYSPANQINRGNVKSLQQVWSTRVDMSERNGALTGGDVPVAVPVTLGPASTGVLKAPPLMVNGVLYISTYDNAWAYDAKTGQQIWHFHWRTSGGEYTGNRGMAMYKSTVFFGTPDGNLVALDAATGKERWHKRLADFKSGYYLSSAPVVAGHHLLMGMAGDSSNIRAWMESRDPETGELQWKWYATPAAGEPGIETWPDAKTSEHGGGQPWQAATYDPQLNLIYFGTGNPDPLYVPEVRKGDNLYTCTLVALNPDTGKLVWYYQTSPNEAWDFDSNQVAVLFDATIAGKPRKLVAQATRNGMYFVWDRATGEHILSTKIAETVNWSTGFNAKGQPVRDDAKLGQAGGALISPGNGGIQNWSPPAYMPQTGSLYINASQTMDIHYATGPADSATGALAHQAQAVGGYDISLRSIGALTGKVQWSHSNAGSEWNPPRPHNIGGLLTTGGGLLFSGNSAPYVVATDPVTSRQLWHAKLNFRVTNTPITFMMDGKQYLVVGSDDTLTAFRLP